MEQGGRPSLGLLATEIQLQILRHILKVDVLELNPLDYYCRPKYGLGSLGILRVSKHFSALGLSILYGENTFKTTPYPIAIYSVSNVAKPGKDCICYVPGTSLLGHRQQRETDWSFFKLGHQDLKCSRWDIVRDLPRDEAAFVSSIDCLDQISQTNPGQQQLKHVHLGLGKFPSKCFMNGILPQILQQMRGLQSLKLELDREGDGWYNLLPDIPGQCQRDSDKWTKRHARRFLNRVKNELTHIKTITFDHLGEEEAPLWMDCQLEKRNAAWVPPVPASKSSEGPLP